MRVKYILKSHFRQKWVVVCVQTPSSCTIWRYRKQAWTVCLLFSCSANPLCARGFSIMIFNTPTLNSDRGISSSACQRAGITFIPAGCSGWNVETFSTDHIYRRKELDAMPDFFETCHAFIALNDWTASICAGWEKRMNLCSCGIENTHFCG